MVGKVHFRKRIIDYTKSPYNDYHLDLAACGAGWNPWQQYLTPDWNKVDCENCLRVKPKENFFGLKLGIKQIAGAIGAGISFGIAMICIKLAMLLWADTVVWLNANAPHWVVVIWVMASVVLGLLFAGYCYLSWGASQIYPISRWFKERKAEQQR